MKQTDCNKKDKCSNEKCEGEKEKRDRLSVKQWTISEFRRTEKVDSPLYFFTACFSVCFT